MVKVLIGDMFKSDAQTLVNTVNCVGVMGKGIALEFKRRFSEMYDDYRRRCEAREIRLGQPYLYRPLLPPWILNFPTKDHWRSVSRLEDIVRGLGCVERHYKEWGITSLAVPPLGCGHGQLEWRIVGPTVYRHLKRMDIPIELYAPLGTPRQELNVTFLNQEATESRSAGDNPATRMRPAWVALVRVLELIEGERYHHLIGRTSFQKIAYFATESGIPTGLSFHRSSYGPYTPEVKALVARLLNNGLIREERSGRMYTVTAGPTFQDAYRAYERELLEWTNTINVLADLFVRMRTQQAKMAATVHFAAKGVASRMGGEPSEAQVLNEVMSWYEKRSLKETDVAAAIRGLSVLGWLNLRPSAELPIGEEAMLDV